MTTIALFGYALKLLTIIFGVKLFKSTESWTKSFLLFTIIHLCLMVLANTIASYGIHNFWAGQLISWWIFLMYALMFYQYMNSLAKKKFILISTLLQAFGIVLINIYIEPITTHPAVTYMVINGGIVINTLLAFLQIYQEEKVSFLERLPFFWINSAIFILYFSTTFLFLIRTYVNYELKSLALEGTLYFMIAQLYHFADILILIGILIMRRQLPNKAIQPITT